MGKVQRMTNSTTGGPVYRMRQILPNAGPEVRKLAASSLSVAFEGYAGVQTWEGGQNVSSVYDSHLEIMAGVLASVPGGLDALYGIARKRYPNEILPYKEYFLNADPEQFGPELKKAITPIIDNQLIPEFVGKNRKRLRALAAAEVQSEIPGGSGDVVDQLAALCARAGRDDYGWRMFLDLRNAEWSYQTFDPIPAEQVPWDLLTSRYREVTLPAGMEKWIAPAFDPAKAGWKTGKSPFGQYNGELPKKPIMKCSEACVGPGCFAATPVNTLWDREVLLMRGAFKIPPLKEGHRYRLRVNDGEHPGAGGGHSIYINGKPLIEAKSCTGRVSGIQPKGAFITREVLDDFRAGQVTIAVKTFIRYNDKFLAPPSTRIPQGHISLHLEEMKLPPMGDDLVLKSATVVPMLSSAWQKNQDPANKELQTRDDMFHYDGTFIANPKVLGAWTAVALVQSPDDFDPAKPVNANSAPFKAVRFQEQGLTDSAAMIWSSDTLMDLDRYQALKMTVKGDHLFIEAGGFSEENPIGWKSPLVVMKRK